LQPVIQAFLLDFSTEFREEVIEYRVMDKDATGTETDFTLVHKARPV